MEAALAQINARIDPDLKERGDRALAAAGYSATAAIRALWQRAAELASNPSALIELLEPAKGAGQAAAPAPAKLQRPPQSEETKRKLQQVDEASKIFENALLAIGVDIHDPKRKPDTRTYEEMRDEAMREHWREKGYNL